MFNRTFAYFGAGLIPIILVLTTLTALAQISPGAMAARQDWAAGNQRDDSGNDHGYNSVNDSGFCIQFKIDYDAQWAILALAQ
jgi:hypothetical protein